MTKQSKKWWARLGWVFPLLTVAGFSMAIPQQNPAIRIEDLNVTGESANPFDLSMRQGLNDADEILVAQNNIDVVTPNTVINNTNVNVVTPNAVINNTNVNVVTPNAVINNTNVNVVTPNAVINNTNVTVNPISGSWGANETGGAISFFPQVAELPSPGDADDDI